MVAQVADARAQLEYVPVGLFGSVMGTTGLSVAWKLAVAQYGGPAPLALVAPTIGIVAIALFLMIFTAYVLKALLAFDAVRTEFRHPIAGNLFGTVFIGLLLLPFVLATYSLSLARAFWVTGAIGMILFSGFIVSRWMSNRQQVTHASPAWIIPVVGLLDVPLAQPVLGLPPMHGLMVFALTVGLFFAVPLFTLIFSRLLFEAPLSDALKPSLLILAVPFAVGYSAYSVVASKADLFASALYMLMLFVLAVLLGQLRNLPRCCPFRIAWWAVSFPLAASAVAALRFAAAEPGLFTDAVAWALLLLATLVITGLLFRTLVGVARNELKTLAS